ncbi:MAG TPA: response regulator [Bryobacteraceae bacterium]|nr:response regulator [Bryobacteraceae bacterium]
MSSRPVARPFHVLLVEDNEGDIYLFRQALQAAGLDVHLTILEDGLEAIAFARREGKFAGSSVPDLAVLDLNLPRVGGIEVLEAFRRIKDFERVPVFIMTSSAQPREQARAMELAVERFITKPPDLDDFLQIGYAVKEVLLKNTPSLPA